MKPATLYLCIAAALLLVAGCASEQEMAVTEDTGPTIEGVWTIAEVETVGGPDEGITVPEAGLMIFTEKYYSSVRTESTEPRALFKTDPPSEAEKVAAFDTFGADSGTYEFDGSTLVLHPTVCQSPNLMAGGSASFDCQLEGDKLTITTSPDRIVIPEIERAPSESTETHYRLERLE